MWGKVPPEPALCSNVSITDVHVVVGVKNTVLFNACDEEDLPVAHSLPSAVDSRLFAAWQGDLERSIAYQGEGVYEVAILAELHGTDVLKIELDKTVAGPPLTVVATCPSVGRSAALDTGAKWLYFVVPGVVVVLPRPIQKISRHPALYQFFWRRL